MLAATIHKRRPELLPDFAGVDPIPPDDPEDKEHSPRIPLSHGYSWDGVQDVTGW